MILCYFVQSNTRPSCLEVFVEEAEKLGLLMNWDKTEILAMDYLTEPEVSISTSHHLELPSKILRMIQILHEDTTSTGRNASLESDPFTIVTGVRQGCVLAPNLFDAVILKLLNEKSGKQSRRIPNGIT